MSYIKVYVHFIWSTKNRYPFLTNDIRYNVFSHIRENARNKNIFVDFINGYTDHVHCLVSMNDALGIEKIVQLIKGESSHWINKNKMTPKKFQWQNEYMAVGVGFEQLEAVRSYIAKQEEHHKKMTSEEEINKFLKQYGFDKLQKDIK